MPYSTKASTLVTIFVLATKTDVQPNFVSGGGTYLRLIKKMNVKTKFHVPFMGEK